MFVFVLLNIDIHAKSVNLLMEPFSVFGKRQYGLAADIPLTPSSTLGPMFYFYQDASGGASLQTFSLGVRLNFYLDNLVFYPSWYLSQELHMLYAHRTLDAPISETLHDFRVMIGLLAGYHFFWPNHVNIRAGIGIKKEIPIKQSVSGTVSSGERYHIDFLASDSLMFHYELMIGFVF